jgi:hypothetical protein
MSRSTTAVFGAMVCVVRANRSIFSSRTRELENPRAGRKRSRLEGRQMFVRGALALRAREGVNGIRPRRRSARAETWNTSWSRGSLWRTASACFGTDRLLAMARVSDPRGSWLTRLLAPWEFDRSRLDPRGSWPTRSLVLWDFDRHRSRLDPRGSGRRERSNHASIDPVSGNSITRADHRDSFTAAALALHPAPLLEGPA